MYIKYYWWLTSLMTALGLSSCGVLLASPVTVPLWIVIGVMFVITPRHRPLWSGCSALMALSFGLLTCWGIVACVDDYTKGHPTQPLVWPMIVLVGAAAVIIWRTQRMSDAEVQDQDVRVNRVGCQVLTLIVVGVVGYVLLVISR